jgi:hypothetical protein
LSGNPASAIFANAELKMMPEILDRYCRFDRTSHFKRFFARDIRLMDFFRMQLDVSNYFVV